MQPMQIAQRIQRMPELYRQHMASIGSLDAFTAAWYGTAVGDKILIPLPDISTATA
jgi:hypothetical protein